MQYGGEVIQHLFGCGMKYTVQGQSYTSKTALQREWRQRLTKADKLAQKGSVKASNRLFKHPKKRGKSVPRVQLEPEQAAWFLEVAMQFPKQRQRIFPTNATDITTVKARTAVFIDRAGVAFGNYYGKKASKYLTNARCIFFQNKADPSQFRTVPADFGPVASQGGASTVTSWMRQAIQHQIDRFRKKQVAEAKKGGKYVCAICDRRLGGVESHVDHGVGPDSFKAIKADFQTNEMKRELKLTDTTNEGVLKRWRAFHLGRAKLRMTCRNCNLTNK